MRHSLYWDDFSKRIDETVACLKSGKEVPVRRVSVFITDRCNFRCAYCNTKAADSAMRQETFEKIVERYGKTALIHITGGEPSVVGWLYPFIRAHKDEYRFHLNTNAYIEPPSNAVQRLKISLDSDDKRYWNYLVGMNAFDRVVSNIKKAIPETVVSVTCTLTKENFRNAVKFADFANKAFPKVYAVFFSSYKGTNQRFVFEQKDADEFFDSVVPSLRNVLPEESLRLMEETLDEKRRIMNGVRFPQNTNGGICYLSMSERVFDSTGNEYSCSHLYRDGVRSLAPKKNDKCSYGCNRRLVDFNKEVESRLGVPA